MTVFVSSFGACQIWSLCLGWSDFDPRLGSRNKKDSEASACITETATALQDFLIKLGIMKGNKQPFTIQDNISGALQPVSLTPPAS